MNSISKLAQLFLVLLVFPATAQAVAIDTVGIEKSFNAVDDVWELNVTNNYTNQFIYAFAVAENAATSADGETDTHGWWDAGVIQDERWDIGATALGGIASPFGLTNLPLFADAFGAGFNKAAIYWLSAFENSRAPFPIVELFRANMFLQSDDPASAVPIGPGETASTFTFTALNAGSPCVALLSNKSSVTANNDPNVPLQLTLASCVTTAAASPNLPEPAVIPLLLVGLLGMFVIKRTGERRV
jgi:hypothetical protein